MPVRVGDFFLLQNIQTTGGGHPFSRAIGTGDSFPEVKAART